MKRFATLAILAFTQKLSAQAPADSLIGHQIREVKVVEQKADVSRLPETQATYLFSGRKSEVISLAGANVNVADKLPRQVFAKVPGVFVYDMDGTGNQTNISTRGLDPHRGWEFNLRTDGIITNSDVYGYPASHFSLPFEAVERIEIVRGTGSLQYGAQFGGMLNYVIKQADTTRRLGIEMIGSAGSFGLFSGFVAAGGRVGKVDYYGFYSRRTSDGYRDNSRGNYDGQFFSMKYRPTARLSVRAEIARSNYLYQIPGPLTDSMFHENPRQSTRSRNYFSPEIWVPSLKADWQIGDRTWLSVTASAVLGTRNSVQFDTPANVVDKIDPVTLAYANRQVDVDRFNSWTGEARLLQGYSLGRMNCAIATGVQIFDNDLHRTQLGKGTTGSDYDMSITGDWGRDLHFRSKNAAFFAENKFGLTRNWSATVGARYESGASKMSGRVSYLEPADIPNRIEHKYPLFGASSEYRLGRQVFYAGFSQAYRPVIFKDIIPANANERADKDLKDAFGYNLEAGWRGGFGGWRWDAGVFLLEYKNRLGSLSETDANGNFYLLRTNIGDSRTRGVELFIEKNQRLGGDWRANVFTSTAFFDGEYTDATVRSGTENRDVKGNRIESVPRWITRNGLSVKWRDWAVSAQYSWTGETFADALNTRVPSATGSVGLVPSYGIWDANISCKVVNGVSLRVSASNLADKQYFTKRPTFYPGPGVWSSDGRSFNASVSVRI